MNAFSILIDPYDKECSYLFNFLQSVLSLPHKENDWEEEIEALLYESAFAFLCQDYLCEAIDMYRVEDFESFLEETGFSEHQKDIEEHFYNKVPKEKLEVEFSENVWELINIYQIDLIKKLLTFFGTKEKVNAVLESIFHICGGTYRPSGIDVFLKIDNFINDIK